MNKLKKDLIDNRLIILVILIYCIIMEITFKTVCPIKAFIHIPCPGCGLTHATLYLITLNFKASFNANPTCILWIVSISLFLINRYILQEKIKGKYMSLIFIIVSIITIISYVYRMLDFYL